MIFKYLLHNKHFPTMTTLTGKFKLGMRIAKFYVQKFALLSNATVFAHSRLAGGYFVENIPFTFEKRYHFGRN